MLCIHVSQMLSSDKQTFLYDLDRKKQLTAVTSLMAHNCSSLTLSTKNGVIPIEET